MRLQNIKANIPEISIDWDINFQESDNIICIIDTKKAKFSFLHLFELFKIGYSICTKISL